MGQPWETVVAVAEDEQAQHRSREFAPIPFHPVNQTILISGCCMSRPARRRG